MVKRLLIDDDVEHAYLLQQEMIRHHINLSFCHTPSQDLKLIFDMLIYRLRCKIHHITMDEDFIYTVRAHGYMLRGKLSLSPNKGLL
ncbi:hypothetical protein PT300_00360 [Enterobacteriaceae bacterium ESL0689]|nr:hypothetical protein [Enterobacteriaceae bacterium ESL0689]